MGENQESILVTGGAGFIGSNFIRFFLSKRNDANILNLDKLTYAGSLENLVGIKDHPRHTFIQGDICDRNLLKTVFEENNITSIIHFAAESHVDNSIAAPAAFIKTNIDGTFALLEIARHYWLDKKPKESCEHRFHHISTDEVYGSLGDTGFFHEKSLYAPNSPYSASKASSDLLVRSYHHTYGLNTVISNCSNNYGPYQHPEKLIPTIIRKALAEEAIPIYGDGKNVRDWLYVEDHCEALERVFNNGKAGETYAIGGNSEKDNISMAKQICELLDKIHPRKSGNYKDLVTFVTDRPGHDYRYAIDASKMAAELQWHPKTDLEEGLQATIEHYTKKIQLQP